MRWLHPVVQFLLVQSLLLLLLQQQQQKQRLFQQLPWHACASDEHLWPVETREEQHSNRTTWCVASADQRLTRVPAPRCWCCCFARDGTRCSHTSAHSRRRILLDPHRESHLMRSHCCGRAGREHNRPGARWQPSCGDSGCMELPLSHFACPAVASCLQHSRPFCCC